MQAAREALGLGKAFILTTQPSKLDSGKKRMYIGIKGTFVFAKPLRTSDET
jgi:hypothetical protein